MLSAFRMLAKFKGMRGGRSDLFSKTEERRHERQLIDDYINMVDEICKKLSPANHAVAVQLARVPDEIRGYGHVKERNLEGGQGRGIAPAAGVPQRRGRCRCGRSHESNGREDPMNALNGYDIEDLTLGMTATFAKTITEADIVLFAGASGDNNAMHINEEFAADHAVQEAASRTACSPPA